MSGRYIKKTIVLNQELIDKAIKLFKVETEEEAVNRSLEVIIEEKKIIDAHGKIGGTGKVERVFK